MIYCVVPRELAGELFDTLAEYYKDEPHVEVIVDRRGQGGTADVPLPHPERRRGRPAGSFPRIEAPSVPT